MNSTRKPTAKVLFRVPEDDGSANVETLWAYDLGEDEYELDNLPFYAYSVSVHDVVHAPHDANEGFPTFQRVVRKSGNRTVRVIFDEPAKAGNHADTVLKGLLALGCDYEGATPNYICINIPPPIALEDVSSFLVRHSAQWEHADPRHRDLYPNDA